MPSGDIAQSVLTPAGLQATRIGHLWALMFGVSATVFVLVIAFVLASLLRGLHRARTHASGTASEVLGRAVGAAVGATVLILFGLLVASVWTGHTVASLRAGSAVSIAVTGHQWWWEVEYEDGVPDRRVRTANEIHVPLHRPVVLKVTSRDVIHSFWAPSLQGKRDLIPGYTTAIWITADRPGRFRGQCAEFCGVQHAHMAFDVVVESEAAFDRWLEHMRLPADKPEDAAGQRGERVFMTARCAGCHAINGTEAHGQIAPDLTHLAARATLGAGTLPNSAPHLGAWVLDPQASKPGNQMPPNPLPKEDTDALLAYLGHLQ